MTNAIDHGAPVKATGRKITHVGSNNRVTRVGYQAVITFADGSAVACEHDHGHRTVDACSTCARKIVSRYLDQFPQYRQ